MTRTAALALCLLLNAMIVTSCSGVSADGPIRMSEEVSTVCTPSTAPASLGVLLPEVLPPGLTIDTVELVNPDGVSIGTSYLMPVPEHFRLMLDLFPPTDQFPGEWRNAVPAIGEPVPTDTPVELIVEIRIDNKISGGSLDGVRFTYTANGKHYQAVSNVGALFSPSGCEDTELPSTEAAGV